MINRYTCYIRAHAQINILKLAAFLRTLGALVMPRLNITDWTRSKQDHEKLETFLPDYSLARHENVEFDEKQFDNFQHRLI